MSRNKQVDRLREELIIRGETFPGKEDGNDVIRDATVTSDPVSYSLELIDHLVGQIEDYKDEMFILSQNRIEDKKFFKSLHYEMVHAGFNEQLVINRPGKTPVSLATLGFNRLYPKIDTAEDRARLIAIISMVIVSMRDQILDEKKKSLDNISIMDKRLEKAYELHQHVVDCFDSKIKKLKDTVQLRDDEITRSCVVIKDITEELKYQVAATTKQYKRELDALRLDIIDREILREEFHN